MIFFRKPNGAQIKEALDQQAKLSFSYAETGATRGAPPPGFNADHNQIQRCV